MNDNRVYHNSDLFINEKDYFGNSMFLLGDSAFTSSGSVVASFKCPRGHQLTEEHEKTNTHMGRLRVTSEHTIGILKARFPFLKCIPMTITESKNSVRRILRVIDCCVILHNLLIDTKDDEEADRWYEDGHDDNVSEIGARLGEYDIGGAIFEQEAGDERLQRCLNNLRDYVFNN